MTQHNLISLYLDECSQELCYYPFAVNIDIGAGSSNTLDDLPSTVYAQNKTKDLNFYVFNMITKKKRIKKVTKHISCKCECKSDGKKCNNNKCWCYWKNQEKHNGSKKYMHLESCYM